jgi:hypothetical protein
VKIVLMKRAPDDEPQARSFNDIMAKAVADDGGDDAGDRSDQNTSLADHPIVQLAQLLVASGRQPDLSAALHYLLSTSHGSALLHRVRTHKAAKDHSMDTVHAIMKDAGIAGVCAQIVQKGSTTISEEEIVSAVSKIAVERWPKLSPAQAFARIYTSATDEARVLQKAIAIAKLSVFGVQPTMVGGVDAMNAANDDTESSEAYAQLGEMAERLRATSSSGLSADQAFARVFTDPKNAVLASKAHRRPSATTSFAFPR